ncbi:hypothetical protein [Deinococcus gobiensis]|uniref:Spore coat protein U domain-containing protein n=1 Tax=Deinococcus gobiensis (strain DSM 21396 / JCM 16679 / CGMCC 1.7299 / I-0) TaxID=745776 RepID=H8H1Z9_DEIGI|nr:hypothetical protein [Deinococcus gobiensis]AFD27546.1 hypothetical protein DGo_PB0277 [Deinococcus gobiensis I-0]
MKKIALTVALAALCSTAFAAGSVSTPITVNATVLSSCTFDTSATGAASFTYDALAGTTVPVNGGATLYCNSGTAITTTTAATGALILKSASKTGTLNATYTLSKVDAAGAGTGTYVGADKHTYTLAATAASGQWGAPTAADYTTTLDVNVTF